MFEKPEYLKNYTFHDLTIQVEMEEKLVHIPNTAALRKFVAANLEDHTNLLYDFIQADYFLHFGAALDISKKSFAIELWGHIYTEEFALFVQQNLSDINLLKKLVDEVIIRTEIIDCGEKSIDSNRSAWDLLSISYPVIVSLFGAKTSDF